MDPMSTVLEGPLLLWAPIPEKMGQFHTEAVMVESDPSQAPVAVLPGHDPYDAVALTAVNV